MDDLPIVTCAQEGGLYSPDCCRSAPIRIYADGRVEDDIAALFTGNRIRQRLDVAELCDIVDAAAANRKAGRV
jgi:hypothetical protein